MTDDDMRRIVREAIFEVLSGLGIEAQQQHEVQADFLYVRKIRKGSEAMGRTIRNSAITVLIPTMVYMIWNSIKNTMGR